MAQGKDKTHVKMQRTRKEAGKYSRERKKGRKEVKMKGPLCFIYMSLEASRGVVPSKITINSKL